MTSTSTIHFTADADRPFVEFGQVQADCMTGLGLLAAEAADDAHTLRAGRGVSNRAEAARLRKAERTLDNAIAAYHTIAAQWPTFGPERP